MQVWGTCLQKKDTGSEDQAALILGVAASRRKVGSVKPASPVNTSIQKVRFRLPVRIDKIVIILCKIVKKRKIVINRTEKLSKPWAVGALIFFILLN